MSFYNMLFGINSQTDLLLAVVGLRPCDVERLRDTGASKDGVEITVYTRTGGGNRDDYPQEVMRSRPEWRGSVDDDFDCTYCTDTLTVPEEWRQDVANLRDPLEHGLRGEFARHIAKTLRREPTEADKAQAAYDRERAALSRIRHEMLNGHTFVPHDDAAMRTALECAEKNEGKLRSCWGIGVMRLEVARDREQYGRFDRVDVSAKWDTDVAYWRHCQEKFGAEFPKAMAEVNDLAENYLDGGRR